MLEILRPFPHRQIEEDIQRQEIAEIVDRLFPTFRLPKDYRGGTPWLPPNTIDYVVIAHSFMQWDRRLRIDWQIYRDAYKLQRGLADFHPHELNQVARAWLAEHHYHKLKTIKV